MNKTSSSATKILLIASILCSCQKETVTHNNDNYKHETDKIETSISSGLVKNESYLTNLPKYETKASNDLKEKIMGALIKSYSKTNATQAVNQETFGVL